MLVSQVEAWLVRQARETLDLAGMDVSVQDGTNADLGPAIVTALRQFGVSPASPLLTTDSELALVGSLSEGAFLLACRIEALETALDRLLGLVDIQIGGGAGNAYRLSQAAQGLSQTITRLRAQFTAWYETGSGRTETGSLDSRYHCPDSELLRWTYRS